MLTKVLLLIVNYLIINNGEVEINFVSNRQCRYCLRYI